MKKFLLIITSIIFVQRISIAQLVNCRPKVCMVDYVWHDDSSPNPTMTAIQNALPDILITNTPGGLWGDNVLPSMYQPLGIKVYSYIAGGWEGTVHGLDTSQLIPNINRMIAIKAGGADGVFLDEVSTFPNSASKSYLLAIDSARLSLNLKLIINPGTYSFDTTFLMAHCDFILTDEQYDTTRNPSVFEQPYLDRVLIVKYGINSDTIASKIALNVRSKGYGFSYVCNSYNNIPSWLGSYLSLTTISPSKPVITQIGSYLHSNAPAGNQWYNGATGIIPNATNQDYTPIIAGDYYDRVTLQGCISDSSNILHFISTGLNEINDNNQLVICPNPANNNISIQLMTNEPYASYKIYSLFGSLVKQEKIKINSSKVNISELMNGIYFIDVTVEQTKYRSRFIVSK